MQDLTGTWDCQDNLTYYFTQRGFKLYGHGTNDAYKNVVMGTIDPERKTLIMEWVDTPDSGGMGNHGICFLDISTPNQMIKIDGDKSFGVGNFTKR